MERRSGRSTDSARSDPRVLDVIDIPVVEPHPQSFQSENWLLDSEHYRERMGMLPWSDMPVLAGPVGQLWLDGHSMYHGRNDKIPLEIADSVRDLLKLFRVDDLQLSVFKPGEAFGNTKRRAQGRFGHGGSWYCLWVTDPVHERQYLAKLDGTYSVGECFLTVSLGEPFGGAVYKFIASIIAK